MIKIKHSTHLCRVVPWLLQTLQAGYSELRMLELDLRPVWACCSQRPDLDFHNLPETQIECHGHSEKKRKKKQKLTFKNLLRFTNDGVCNQTMESSNLEWFDVWMYLCKTWCKLQIWVQMEYPPGNLHLLVHLFHL